MTSYQKAWILLSYLTGITKDEKRPVRWRILHAFPWTVGPSRSLSPSNAYISLLVSYRIGHSCTYGQILQKDTRLQPAVQESIKVTWLSNSGFLWRNPLLCRIPPLQPPYEFQPSQRLIEWRWDWRLISRLPTSCSHSCGSWLRDGANGGTFTSLVSHRMKHVLMVRLAKALAFCNGQLTTMSMHDSLLP